MPTAVILFVNCVQSIKPEVTSYKPLVLEKKSRMQRGSAKDLHGGDMSYLEQFSNDCAGHVARIAKKSGILLQLS